MQNKSFNVFMAICLLTFIFGVTVMSQSQMNQKAQETTIVAESPYEFLDKRVLENEKDLPNQKAGTQNKDSTENKPALLATDVNENFF